MSSERGAGAAAQDDAGHDAAHLPHRGDCHQIGDVDGRAELHQLHSADKSQDKAHEKIDHRHNSQRLRAALLHDQKCVRPTKLRATTQQIAQSCDVFAKEREHLQSGGTALECVLTHPLEQPTFDRRVMRILFFRHCFGKPQQPAHAFGKSAVSEFDLARSTQFGATANEGDEA